MMKPKEKVESLSIGDCSDHTGGTGGNGGGGGNGRGGRVGGVGGVGGIGGIGGTGPFFTLPLLFLSSKVVALDVGFCCFR